MFYIRVDGNSNIGLGHIMRCLSIAEQVREFREQVTFIISDDGAIPLLEKKKYSYFVLNSDYRDMEGELEVLTAYLDAISAKRLLIDSYFVTPHYLKTLRDRYKVAYLDDVNAFAYPVHMVINYNLYANKIPYEEQFIAMERKESAKKKTITNIPKYLLGCDYVPLRKEFTYANVRERSHSDNVLVTMGGSDPGNLSAEFLKYALAQDSPIARKHYLVVTTEFNTHLPELRDIENKHTNVKLYVNCEDMAGLMRQAEVAVTAAGSTIYELCAMGVPFICFATADNQEQLVAELEEQQIAISTGNYLRVGVRAITDAVAKTEELCKDTNLWQSYQKREVQLVDGHGANRIAEEFMDFSR